MVGLGEPGSYWYLKMFNRLIGEKTYNFFRMERRVLTYRFYYIRQCMLYE